jgi:hypothetical protein
VARRRPWVPGTGRHPAARDPVEHPADRGYGEGGDQQQTQGRDHRQPGDGAAEPCAGAPEAERGRPAVHRVGSNGSQGVSPAWVGPSVEQGALDGPLRCPATILAKEAGQPAVEVPDGVAIALVSHAVRSLDSVARSSASIDARIARVA